MYDLIFLLGAQGSGKTTIAKLLKEKLESPHIDFDWIRGFHLNKEWSNTNDSELEMTLNNLIAILKNYLKHKYQNILVSGFTETDVEKMLNEFKNNRYKIITLIVANDKVLQERVLTESRDSGFRDFEESIKFNRRLREKLTFPNEHKIDNTNQSPEETASYIKDLLSK